MAFGMRYANANLFRAYGIPLKTHTSSLATPAEKGPESGHYDVRAVGSETGSDDSGCWSNWCAARARGRQRARTDWVEHNEARVSEPEERPRHPFTLLKGKMAGATLDSATARAKPRKTWRKVRPSVLARALKK